MLKPSKLRVALAALVILLLPRGSTAADCTVPLFQFEESALQLGGWANSIGASDFDGDGTIDVVTANSIVYGDTTPRSGSLSFLWGKGDGTFGPANILPIDKAPVALVVRDIDGDGRDDLVLAHGTAFSLSWLRNQGGRRFAAGDYLTVGRYPYALVAEDLDGNGTMDLACPNSGAENVSVLLNWGNGQFAPAKYFPAGAGAMAMAAGDLDGDADIDLVTGSGTDDLKILWNDGKGAFSAPESVVGNSPLVITADFNRDGYLDLAMGTAPGSVTVRLNHQDGTFERQWVYNVKYPPASIVAADIDTDGVVDLVATADAGFSGSGSTLSLLLNRGDGKFDVQLQEFPGFHLGPMAVSDFDNDLDLDLAAIGGNSSITNSPKVMMFLNNIDATFLPPEPYPIGVYSRSTAAGDLNGDALPDLAITDGYYYSVGDGIAISLNEGGGRFQAPIVYKGGGESLITADFDGDGALDLATGRITYPGVAVTRNRGDGTLEDPALYRAGGPIIAAVDLDRDGNLDLITDSLEFRQASVLLNRGDGTFEKPVFYSGGGSTLITGDFDLDGYVDLVEPRSDTVTGLSVVSVYRNQHNGTFADPQDFPTPDARILIAASLKGNGVLDLIGIQKDSLLVLHNDGHASFNERSTLETGLIPTSLVAADLDGDRDLDLAVAYDGTFDYPMYNSGISVIRNLGDGRLDKGVNHPTGGGPRFLQAMDLDGDGDLDLIATTQEGTCCTDGPIFSISVLVNRGDGNFLPESRSLLDRTRFSSILFHPPLTADFDGDGRTDLAWESRSGPGLILLSRPALDRNQNGIPDECERSPFHRGDPDGTGQIDINDVAVLLGFLFLGGDPLACLESADANSDGAIDITDCIFILGYEFLAGPPPGDPGPPGAPCGPDPDPAGSTGDLGCESYGRC